MRSPLGLGATLLTWVLLSQPAAAQAPQPSQQDLAAARSACAADVQKLCPGVPAGGGQILACLKQHKDEVSSGCKQAVMKVLQPNGPAPASPPTASDTPAIPAPAQAPPNAPATAATTAPVATAHHASAAAAKPSSATSDKYFLMQQVKIVDQGLGQGRTAYNLMVPTTWTFKGWVNVGVAEYGCFADFFAVVGDGFSADHSVELQIIPQYTFQYFDDPQAQQYAQHQNQLAARVGAKPCPVRAPMRAADFLQQELIGKYRKNGTVVSTEAFPELEQMTRQRLGLPPMSAGGQGTGAVRTDSARVRVAYNNDKGQPMEQWLTAVIVVRTSPNGRGMAYDWHAVNVMAMDAPKGKLDENDKLLKLIASTIHVDPQWQSWSNGKIAELYQKKAEEEAKQSAIIAAFQKHAADVINGVTANAMKGSMNSAFGADQGIRGVQTFRDPSTGATYEMSNQYDHAWLNGSNQYVMSEDPNFNPNGNLNGSWNSLQVVRPAP